MKSPDAYLGVSGYNHSQITADVMQAFEKELDQHPANIVLVVDDTTASMSCAIVAKNADLRWHT